jgi:predicted ATP-grasp superfamily ATP-dependent carboligase
MNIAIINAESRKAVSIIRSLGRAGHNIITLSFERISFAGCSKYVHKNYYMRGLDVEGVHEKLLPHDIDIIFPIEDSSIELAATNRDRFKDYVLIIPDYDDFILFADKANTIKLAAERGIPVPATETPASLEAAEEYLNTRRAFPLVIKPRRSTGSIGLKIVRNRNEAILSYRAVSQRFHLPLIQEYIPPGGKAVGAEFLFYRGEEILSFSHQRIREFPVKNGPSTYCKWYKGDDALEEGRKLFQDLDYSGFAMVEFKEHPIAKTLCLMEVNPRPWGSITLPISMGYDFPNEAVRVFSGRRNDSPPHRDVDVAPDQDYFMRWFLPGDLLSIVLSDRLSLGGKCRELFRRYHNTAYQIMSRDDPKPAWAMTLKLFLNLFNAAYIRKYLLRRG